MNFNELVEGVDPALRSICVALRGLVQGLHPEFVEIIWPNQRIASYGMGPKKMSEHYVYIAPQSKHVNLGFYHGAVVPDQDSLLEGTGKRLRHVKILRVEEAESAAIGTLVSEAIAERRKALGAS